MTFKSTQTELKLRRKLLGTASAVAALAAFQMPEQALAGDEGGSDWHLTLDLGGQFTFNDGKRTDYFDVDPNPNVGLSSGGDGWAALNLETDGWIFGLSFNYGRTGTSHAAFEYLSSNATRFSYYAASGIVRHNESHKMLDFTVGQDFGLGMFGMEGSSVISGGVRWANLAATTVGSFSTHHKYDNGFFYSSHWDNELHRTFNGIGPVISWAASTPISDPGSHLTFDWGVSAAVLFGSRKFWDSQDFIGRRSENGTVPQVGGYLGLGWTPDDSRASFHLGYAVQANWGVFDGNIDHGSGEVKFSADRIWHGPYLDLTLHMR